MPIFREIFSSNPANCSGVYTLTTMDETPDIVINAPRASEPLPVSDNVDPSTTNEDAIRRLDEINDTIVSYYQGFRARRPAVYTAPTPAPRLGPRRGMGGLISREPVIHDFIPDMVAQFEDPVAKKKILDKIFKE